MFESTKFSSKNRYSSRRFTQLWLWLHHGWSWVRWREFEVRGWTASRKFGVEWLRSGLTISSPCLVTTIHLSSIVVIVARFARTSNYVKWRRAVVIYSCRTLQSENGEKTHQSTDRIIHTGSSRRVVNTACTNDREYRSCTLVNKTNRLARASREERS